MKKLLFITYSFPPIHGVESTMSLNYVRYLPEMGWLPIVVTRKESLLDTEDFSDLKYIPSSIRVYRGSSIDILILNLLKRLISFFQLLKVRRVVKECSESKPFNGALYSFLRKLKFLPNRSSMWLPIGLLYCLKAIQDNQVSVIVSRSGSITCHMIALILKTITGLPWVASFSDPWITDPNNVYRNMLPPEGLVKKYDEVIERAVVFAADRIVQPTSQLRNEYSRRYPMISREKLVVIPNSHDPERIQQCKGFEKDDKFKMTYTGNFMNLRTPEPFFKALNLMKTEKKNLNEKISVNLIGDLHEFEYLISKYDLEDIINNMGRVSHNEVFSYLNKSDLLLLIDAPAYSMCLASKLVEYIFMGKPILAITSENGAAADVVRATKTGIVVSPFDIVGIKSAIERFRDDFSRGILAVKPNIKEIDKYNARNCASRFVDIFNELVNKYTNVLR